MQAADSPIAHALRTQATIQVASTSISLPPEHAPYYSSLGPWADLCYPSFPPSLHPLNLTCTPSSSALLVDSGCSAAARVERSARLRGCSRWPSLPSGRRWPPGRLFSRAPCHRRRNSRAAAGDSSCYTVNVVVHPYHTSVLTADKGVWPAGRHDQDTWVRPHGTPPTFQWRQATLKAPLPLSILRLCMPLLHPSPITQSSPTLHPPGPAGPLSLTNPGDDANEPAGLLAVTGQGGRPARASCTAGLSMTSNDSMCLAMGPKPGAGTDM